MKSLNISEVRNHLPELIDGVAQTREPVMVMRYGTPVVRIVPVTPDETGQTRYPLRGKAVTLDDDFDAPMPQLWQAMAVAESPGEYAVPKRHSPKKGGKP